jgi:hypothetical protein
VKIWEGFTPYLSGASTTTRGIRTENRSVRGEREHTHIYWLHKSIQVKSRQSVLGSARFSEAQRQATALALEIAGFATYLRPREASHETFRCCRPFTYFSLQQIALQPSPRGCNRPSHHLNPASGPGIQQHKDSSSFLRGLRAAKSDCSVPTPDDQEREQRACRLLHLRRLHQARDSRHPILSSESCVSAIAYLCLAGRVGTGSKFDPAKGQKTLKLTIVG